jgi:AraC family transcriptional regulator
MTAIEMNYERKQVPNFGQQHALSDDELDSLPTFVLLGRLLDAARASFDFDRDTARASLNRATALLNAEMRAKDLPKSDGCNLAPWQMRKTLAWIETHIASSFTLRELAVNAQLSKGHFARAFKGSFGEPPHTFVLKRRISRAQHMMLTTSDSLSQVSLDCGFADQSHFCRVFRDVVGASPNEWRRARLAA